MLALAISAAICLVSFIAAVLTSLPESKPPQEEKIGWLDVLSGEAIKKADRELTAKSDRRWFALSLWGMTVLSGLSALFLGIGLFS